MQIALMLYILLQKIKNSKPTLVGITKYDEASFDEIMERASEKLQNNFVFQEIKALSNNIFASI